MANDSFSEKQSIAIYWQRQIGINLTAFEIHFVLNLITIAWNFWLLVENGQRNKGE